MILYSSLQHFLFILIPKQNGIQAGDQRVLFVDFLKFITAGKQLKINSGFVRYILQKLYFFSAEAVDFDLRQIISLRESGILPEHGVAGIEDWSHTDEFQGVGISKNAEIIQMTVGVSQNKIGQNLIFQEGTSRGFVQTVHAAHLNEMFVEGNVIILLPGIHNIDGRDKLNFIGSEALADAAQGLIRR